jgi:predicted PolB exonuclease-like 3'-5' exonuclease
MSNYLKYKVTIYKYIDSNREKWNEYQKEYKRNNKEKINKIKMKCYYYKVEAKRQMNILLD